MLTIDAVRDAVVLLVVVIAIMAMPM